ncbi:MAG: NAD(P)/FAD-dependent oxidoreductase [Candidatus Heimdallarchaeota archaeon]
MVNAEYEVIIVGGGPAGLAAGIGCSDWKLKTVIFEGGTWGGLLATIYPHKQISNYPGFPGGVIPLDLVKDMLSQVRDAPIIEMKNERVLDISMDKQVKTTEGEYTGKVIILATGSRPRELGIPGERKFSRKNRGVAYYVTHPEQFVEKRVLIVGGGDTAMDAAIDLMDLAAEIIIVHRRDTFRAMDVDIERVLSSGKVEAYFNTELHEIKGVSSVDHVILWNNIKKQEFSLETDWVILAVGLTPNTEIFEKLGLEQDKNGCIITDRQMRTNIEGIFAIGDVDCADPKLIVVAAAEGAIAAKNAYTYVKRPYWA